MIDSNCVSQFQDVGCGFPQQQVAGILVPPAVEEIVEIVPIIQERFQQSIEEQIVVAPSPAREGRWKSHLAEQVPVIEHVTPTPDAVHAAVCTCHW